MSDLEERLRKLRPEGIDRQQAPTQRAEERIAAIMSVSTPPVPLKRPAKRSVLWTAVAAVVVIMVTVFATTLRVSPVYAVTPAPLTFTQSGATMEEIVKQAQNALSSGGISQPQRHSRILTWSLHLSDPGLDGEMKTPGIISPQIIERTWSPDESAVQRVTWAMPYWADRKREDHLPDDVHRAGEVYEEVRFQPGEFAVPSTAVPGESRTDMQQLLTSFGLPEFSSAGDTIAAIGTAMELWTLTNAQQSVLLDILATADGIEAAGIGTDRAGRNVVALSGKTSSGELTYTLLVSVETGRIIGIETTRSTPEPPLSVGDVISYQLWELSGAESSRTGGD